MGASFGTVCRKKMAVLLLACAATLDVVGVFAVPSQLGGESAYKSDDEIPGFHFIPHSVHKDRPRFNW